MIFCAVHHMNFTDSLETGVKVQLQCGVPKVTLVADYFIILWQRLFEPCSKVFVSCNKCTVQDNRKEWNVVCLHTESSSSCNYLERKEAVTVFWHTGNSYSFFYQVSGRLHVEVVRVSGEIDDRLVGGEDSPDYSNENDVQERKLVCRVSSSYIPTYKQPSVFPSQVLNLKEVPDVLASGP